MRVTIVISALIWASASSLVLRLPKRHHVALSALRRSEHDIAPAGAEEPPQGPQLLRRPLGAALWTVAWPTITIGLMRSLYDLVDAFWLGKLGLHQLEAVGAVSFALWIVWILGELGGIGVQSLTSGRCSPNLSRSLYFWTEELTSAAGLGAEGAGKRREVGPLVVQGLWVGLFTAICCLASIPFTGGYLRTLGVGPESMAWGYGQSYLRWSLVGSLPLITSGIVASGFKGIGSMRPVLGVTSLCVVINAILDPLFIWGVPGMVPAMGVAGAAVATQASNWIALFLSVKALRKQGIDLRFRLPKLDTMRRIFTIGGPMAGAGLAFTAVYIILGRILRGLGEANLAALGLGHRVESLAFVTTEGFGAAAATVVGQWLGAGNEAKARLAARRGSWISSAVLAGAGLLTFLCAGPIVSLFTTDPVVWGAAVSYLRIVSFIFPAMAQEMVYEGALAGAGDTVNAFIASLVCNLGRIPLAYYFSQAWGVQGVWYAICVSTLLKAYVKRKFFERSRLPLLATPKALVPSVA